MLEGEELICREIGGGEVRGRGELCSPLIGAGSMFATRQITGFFAHFQFGFSTHIGFKSDRERRTKCCPLRLLSPPSLSLSLSLCLCLLLFDFLFFSDSLSSPSLSFSLSLYLSPSFPQNELSIRNREH